jgi:hypothetical protein
VQRWSRFLRESGKYFGGDKQYPGQKEAKERERSQSQDERGKAERMTDLVNFVMLIAASAGSMAFGVLAAYGVLRAGFALMRPQNQAVVLKPRARVARV